MTPEILAPVFLVAVGILFFFLRRWSELPLPKRPETAARKVPPSENSPDTILINHPMILRAAERAWADGGESAKRYIQKNGDRIYLTFSSIRDPIARRKAVDIVRSIEEGTEVSIADALQLLRHLFASA